MIIDYEEYRDGQWTRVAEKVSVETDFQIDPDLLDREICSLPNKLIHYGFLYAQLKSEVDRKGERVKFIYSHLALGIRSTEKATENTVKEKVTVDTQYQTALAEYNHSLRNAALTESWYRSMNKKADLLQALTYRESSEIKRRAY